ncbi:hypothetical protein FOFC_07288 [Fusarium oxysporum]|nr:hypothetical protein FOFC_07288 [Fusarium oxysporum]
MEEGAQRHPRVVTLNSVRTSMSLSMSLSLSLSNVNHTRPGRSAFLNFPLPIAALSEVMV